MLVIMILMDRVNCMLLCIAKVVKRFFKFKPEESAFESRYFFCHLHLKDFETHTCPIYNQNCKVHPTTVFADCLIDTVLTKVSVFAFQEHVMSLQEKHIHLAIRFQIE